MCQHTSQYFDRHKALLFPQTKQVKYVSFLFSDYNIFRKTAGHCSLQQMLVKREKIVGAGTIFSSG